MDNSRVVILTYAYNAEKTLARTIESVLNQTHSNFLYIIVDNGSKDLTLSIINEYAAKDPRILPLHNDVNNPTILGQMVGYLDNEILREGDFLTFLDADDTYSENFFQSMLGFIEENSLDIAACCSDFIDSKTNKISNQISLNENIICKSDGEMVEKFPLYFRYIRDPWGMMFKKKCFFKVWSLISDIIQIKLSLYMTLSMMLNTDSFGVLAKHLHQHYLYRGSVSKTFAKNRFVSFLRTFSVCDAFLINKSGDYLSNENTVFLVSDYFKNVSSNVPLMIEHDEHKLIRQLKVEMVGNLISCQTIFQSFCIEDEEKLPSKMRKEFLENILNFLRYIDDNNPSEYEQEIIINVLSTLYEYCRCGAKLEA